jgi:hypothetical protein
LEFKQDLGHVKEAVEKDERVKDQLKPIKLRILIEKQALLVKDMV